MNNILIRYNGVELCQGENIILKDVNFEQCKGEFLYIIGKVGSGKSTFIKTLYCEMPIHDGEACICNYNLRNIKKKQIPMLRRNIGIVFQDCHLLTEWTVYDNLAFVLKATGWKRKNAMDERILEVLSQVEMVNKAYKRPYELSGGEKQRIMIARSLLNSPKIILADEPTGNLDMESGRKIVQLLHNISSNGTAVIMATHNYRWIHIFPARVKRCEDNKLFDCNDTDIQTLNDVL